MSLELLLAPVTEYNTVSKPHSLKDPRFIQEQFYSPNEDATLVKPKKYNPVAKVINRLPVYQSVFKPKRTTDTNAFRTTFREQFALKQETPTFIGWSEIDKFRWVSTATTRQLESVRPENYFGVRLYKPDADTHVIIDFDFRIATEAQLRSDGYYLIDTNEKPVSFDDPRFIEIFKSVKNIWLDRKTYKPISRSYIIRESIETQQLTTLNDNFESLKNEYAKILKQNYDRTRGKNPVSPDNYDEVYKALENALNTMSVTKVNADTALSTAVQNVIELLGWESTIRYIAMSVFFNICLDDKFNNSLLVNKDSISDVEIENIKKEIKDADSMFGFTLEKRINNMDVDEYKSLINRRYDNVRKEIIKKRNKLNTKESDKLKGWHIVNSQTFNSNYNNVINMMVEDFNKNKQSKPEEPKPEEPKPEEPKPEEPKEEPKSLDPESVEQPE